MSDTNSCRISIWLGGSIRHEDLVFAVAWLRVQDSD